MRDDLFSPLQFVVKAMIIGQLYLALLNNTYPRAVGVDWGKLYTCAVCRADI
jgi:hypothetical protein